MQTVIEFATQNTDGIARKEFMSIDKISTAIQKILDRTDLVKGEEATKQAMILPMLEALGYDIWNPAEVCPEFIADTTVKKNGQKEKVDFAIILNEKPRIFIEVKAYGENLDGHHGQLKRYFTSTPSVSLGILTNGTEYRFFTDTGEINIQDDIPFFVSNLTALDQGLDIMARFQKQVFSGEAIREFATELKYTEKLLKFLRTELDMKDGGELSEGFMRWILATPGLYDGRVTINIVERFRPLAKTALQKVIRNIVRRSVAAMDQSFMNSANDQEETNDFQDKEIDTLEEETISDNENDSDGDAESIRKSCSATDEQLDAFAIIKQQFENSSFADTTIYDPSTKEDIPIEIGYKNTSTYCNIYFNKSSWWNLRLSLEGRLKWIHVDIEPETGRKLTPAHFNVLPSSRTSVYRVQINNINELNELEQLILGSFEKTVADREKFRSRSLQNDAQVSPNTLETEEVC
jgi:hypothetical protein